MNNFSAAHSTGIQSSDRASELRNRIGNKFKTNFSQIDRPQVAARKKLAASRPWLQIDSEGHPKVFF
jgi:hypothetical protein